MYSAEAAVIFFRAGEQFLRKMRGFGSMKIGIGNDHSALGLKAEIIEFVENMGHEVADFGTNSAESCDYPVYGEK